MSKKITIHKNELDRINETKVKKPKWINTSNVSLFQTFTQKKIKTKNQREVERKLALADLTLDALQEKYGNITDSHIYIIDIYGNCLWMNQLAFDTFWRDQDEYFMLPVHQKWGNDNAHNPEFQKKLDYLLEELPKTFELSENAQTPFGEFYFKGLWERIETKKGSPLGYLSTIKIYQVREEQEQETRKKRTKDEFIQEKFTEYGVGSDIYQIYDSADYQVIFIDMLGRLLWMNQMFKKVNFKGEDDLLESLYGFYGFEAFEEGLEFVFAYLPKYFQHQTIDYKRIDSSTGKPFGYLIFFYSLIQSPISKSKLEISKTILERAKFPYKLLEEKFGKLDKIYGVWSLGGRIVWMNEKYQKVYKKKSDDIMLPIIYLVLKQNEENEFLQETLSNFFYKKLDSLQISFVLSLTVGGSQKATLNLKRWDSQEGTPLLYFVEINEF